MGNSLNPEEVQVAKRAWFVVLVLFFSGCETAEPRAEREQAFADSVIASATSRLVAKEYESLVNDTSTLDLSGLHDTLSVIRAIAQDSIDARVLRQRKAATDSLLRLVRSVPEQDYAENIRIYSRLSQLDTENADEYREKVRQYQESRDRARVRSTLRITSFRTSRPNSAGGVDVYMRFVNTSDKTIKYLSWTAEPYNAVDDIVSDELGRGSERSGRYTGPVRPGASSDSDVYWETVWYNPTIVRAELRSVSVEYMDGSTARLSAPEVRLAMN